MYESQSLKLRGEYDHIKTEGSQNQILSHPVRHVKDTIYSEYIRFPTYIWNVIDNPVFARLKNLYQLGAAYYVFPGATHTRFSHALGSAHLASKYVEHLMKIDAPLGRTGLMKQDQDNVVIAALVHELGYGPYSHVFNIGAVPELIRIAKHRGDNVDPRVLSWTPAESSIMLLDYMIEQDSEFGPGELTAMFSDEQDEALDLDFIKKLVRGEQTPDRPHWVSEIVKNQRNAFDVDKLDYLCRDDFHCGINQQHGNQDSINYMTIMKNTKIIPIEREVEQVDLQGNKQTGIVQSYELAYDIRKINSIKMVFEKRFENFRAIYNNRRNQAFDLMFQEALVEADAKYKFLDNLYKPEQFVRWTDMVFSEIRFSEDPLLQKSRAILERVALRQPYVFVGEWFVVTQEEKEEDINSLEQYCQDIANNAGAGTKDDIVIHEKVQNYGKGEDNPMDNLNFYELGERGADLVKKVDYNELGVSLPSRFQETYMRVFVKNPDLAEAVKKGFKTFADKRGKKREKYLG